MWRHLRPELVEFSATKEGENARFCSRAMSETELFAIRQGKLRRTLDEVRRRSPYYRERLRDVGRWPSVTDLRDLPMTTKEDLRANRDELACIPLQECDLYCETTGTTGEAAASPRHALDRIWVVSNWAHAWQHMVPAGGGVVGICGPTELHGMVDSFTDVFHRLGRCVAKIYPFSTKVNFEKALKVMKQLPVEILCVTPTVALMLAKAARGLGYDTQRDFRLKRIFLTGELCSDAMCRNVASFWPAEVTNNPFASQEALGFSTGAADGRLYTFPLSYVYELVDPATGEPTADGRRGELVITMIEPGARPLIRFRTGDFVELAAPRPGAPLPSASVTPLGRTRDILTFEGGRAVTAYEVEQALLAPLERIVSYQLTIEPTGHGSRLVAELEVERGRVLREEELDAAAGAVHACTGTCPVVRQVDQTDGAANMGALAGWKAARLKDLTATVPDPERALAERVGARRAG